LDCFIATDWGHERTCPLLATATKNNSAKGPGHALSLSDAADGWASTLTKPTKTAKIIQNVYHHYFPCLEPLKLQNFTSSSEFSILRGEKSTKLLISADFSLTSATLLVGEKFRAHYNGLAHLTH
jgi:hypothetical protein